MVTQKSTNFKPTDMSATEPCFHAMSIALSRVLKRKSFSKSTSRQGISGQDWTSKVYFYQNADLDGEAGSNTIEITDKELIKILPDIIEVDETIEKVTVYKQPLNEWQPFLLFWYHTFIIFKTESWYWSIEKNTEGITIQRGKILENVKSYYRKQERFEGIVEAKSDESEGSVWDLLIWLYHKNELHKSYHFWSSNCKDFVDACFNYVAKTGKREPCAEKVTRSLKELMSKRKSVNIMNHGALMDRSSIAKSQDVMKELRLKLIPNEY